MMKFKKDAINAELAQVFVDIEAMLNATRRSIKSMNYNETADVVGTLHAVLDKLDDAFCMVHTINEKER